MGAAKSALEVSCRYFAVALAPRGITVNTISPGWIDDSVLNTLPDPVVQMIREHHENGWTPMRRLGTPADIGERRRAASARRKRDGLPASSWRSTAGMGLMEPALPLAIQQPELQAQAV